jgi:hypothetical protein
MTKEQVRDVLLAGEPVLDIGQIDAETKKVLAKWTRDGRVLAGWSHRFPLRKKAWLLVEAHPSATPLEFMTAGELRDFSAKFGATTLRDIADAGAP